MATGVGALDPAADLRPRPLCGHLWTVAGYLRDQVRPPGPPAWVPFTLRVPDDGASDLRLSGKLNEAGDDALVIVLHGIAGDCDSAYAVRVARAAARAGVSCLRLNARGADGSGQDLFHAGLTDDLHAVLASSQLERYRSLHVLGFSLGGHVALRAATQAMEPRLRSVAAVCSPLDLSECATAFDRPVSWVYRRLILNELARRYAEVAARRPLVVPPERVRRARTLREFDGLTVAPRFGFTSAEDYYRRMSVGPVLDRLQVPALLVLGVSDPLVPVATVTRFLRPPASALTVSYVEPGGHVGFPSGSHLGLDAPAGVEHQALAWLAGG